jgi:hypothetical protein
MIVNDSATTLGTDQEPEMMKMVEIEVDQETEIETQEQLVDEGAARKIKHQVFFQLFGK